MSDGNNLMRGNPKKQQPGAEGEKVIATGGGRPRLGPVTGLEGAGPLLLTDDTPVTPPRSDQDVVVDWTFHYVTDVRSVPMGHHGEHRLKFILKHDAPLPEPEFVKIISRTYGGPLPIFLREAYWSSDAAMTDEKMAAAGEKRDAAGDTDGEPTP